MVRHYKRVSGRKSWTQKNLEAAIEAVETGTPINRAASEHSIPSNTLKRYLLPSSKPPEEQDNTLGRYKTMFTQQQEKELVDYILEMEKTFYGVTPREIRSIAFQLATANGIDHPFDKKTELAGVDCLHGFKKRHPELSLRTPEATSAARAQGFNEVAVNGFFDMLRDVLEKNNYKKSQIRNVDETSVMTVQTKRSKVLALKGRRQVGCITSAERGILSTACVCMSAAGDYLPPMIIFPRERLTDKLKVGAPPDTTFCCNSTGWMNLDTFDQWFDHYIEHVCPSETNKQLLILDGHFSHAKNLAFLEKAKEHHVTVITIPPHCSHRMQPLDVSFMGPLKTNFSQATEGFLKRNPGKVVTLNDISGLFGEAYQMTATKANAINGFEATGVCPYNRFVFKEKDFAPSKVTDVCNNDVTMSDRAPEPPLLGDELDINDDLTLEPPCYGFDNTGEEVMPDLSQSMPNQPTPNASREGTRFVPAMASTSREEPACSSKQNTSEGFKISPTMIRPLPKVTGRQISHRRREKATELTGEAHLSALKAAQATKDILQVNRALKRARKKPSTVVKSKKTKRQTDKENIEDSLCAVCGSCFSSSNYGEGWSKCHVCKTWFHQCCGSQCPSCY